MRVQIFRPGAASDQGDPAGETRQDAHSLQRRRRARWDFGSRRRAGWRPEASPSGSQLIGSGRVQVRRQGGFGAIKVSTSILLLTGMRAGVLAVTFSNSSARVQKVPVQINISGDLALNDCRVSFDNVNN